MGPRSGVTEQVAIDIYKYKLARKSLSSDPHFKSKRLSIFLGVSAKTVKAIWSRRSWAHATRHLWSVEDQQLKVVEVIGISISVVLSESDIFVCQLRCRASQLSAKCCVNLKTKITSARIRTPCVTAIQKMPYLQHLNRKLQRLCVRIKILYESINFYHFLQTTISEKPAGTIHHKST